MTQRLFQSFFLLNILFGFALSSQSQTVGVEDPNFNSDSTAEQKEPVLAKFKIDPFVANYRGIEGAGLLYDSLTWNFEGVQNYHPMYRSHFTVQSIGDAGMPAIPRLINQGNGLGFNHGYNHYKGYIYNHSNVIYLRTFTPFTTLQYIQTKNEYVHLQGMHSQNITPGWNVGVRFQTINNAGFYPRQRSSLRQVQLSSRYMSLSNKYYLQVSFNYNRFRLEENGGWLDEENFDQLTGTNKSAEVKLNNSGSYYGDREYAIEQVYWFAGTYRKTSDTTRYYKPILGIKHQSVFGKTFNRFQSEGPDLLEFPAIYLDSFQTNDSSAFAKQVHRLGIVNYVTDSTALNYYAGAGAEILKVHYLNFAKINPGNNLFLDGEVTWREFKTGIKVEGEGRLYLAGFNAGDVSLDGTLSYSSKKSKDSLNGIKRVYARLTQINRTPAFLMQTFYSNHRQWQNNFGKENILKIEGGISGKLRTGIWSIKLVNSLITNPVYMDSTINPAQFSGVVNQTELWLTKNIKVGKFHLNNQMIFQLQATPETRSIMPTPLFSTYNSLFYQNDLFKKALKLQLGVDVRWFSEYFANAYDPVTRMFYNQQDRQQGNYPMCDFFAAAEIKTFRGFLKLEHANFELMDENFPNLYYSTRGYSLAPRRLVFGVIWKMYQ